MRDLPDYNMTPPDYYDTDEAEDDTPAPILCWHCNEPIEDYEAHEYLDDDMVYHVECLID